MMDWVQRRDRWGLVVTFPFQNPELLHVAPELAGRALHLEIHGVDTAHRRVFAGADLLPQVLRRLPRWRVIAPLLELPGVSALLRRLYLGLASRRYQISRGRPYQR